MDTLKVGRQLLKNRGGGGILIFYSLPKISES